MIDLQMTNEAYHAMAGVLSNSGLSALARSPAHFHGLYLDVNRPPREAKSGQLEGTLAHCATLEPNDFSSRYAIGPELNRNTKEWKAFAAEAAAGGRVAIQQPQAAAAFAQADSVHRLPDVFALLDRGHAEVSAFWTDEETGVPCRVRPDWVFPVDEKRVILLDLKTYSDASAREFAKQVDRKGYARQAAFYTDGYAAAAGVEVVGFVFCAVETAWPYVASAFMLQSEWMDHARDENRRLLRTYAECLNRHDWPAYEASIQMLDLPPYLARQAATA